MVPRLDPPRRRRWLIVLFSVLACVFVFTLHQMSKHPGPSTRETTTTGARMEPDPDAPLVGAANAACTSHASCSDKELCTRGRCEPITNRTPECRRAMVRFARGAADLSSTARMTVERAARCIRAGQSPTVAFEESRDALAPKQRNDELTQARRKAVRDALEQRAVPREYIDAIDAQR